MSPFVGAAVVSGLPHPLLTPDASPGYRRLRDAYDRARDAVQASGADVLVVYSTMWPSVIGHQIQADPEPEWVHVDELFHHLGSIPYRFRIDADLAHGWKEEAVRRGLSARTVAYHGFPIDTGSVVALKLLNPDNAIPATIVSSNVYADRAETLVLAKSCVETLQAQGKKAFAICVMSLSNRLFTDWIDPADDRVHSPKDDEWNRKCLEFLGEGRVEDLAQLSRAIQKQIRVHKVVNFKPMWWLSGVLGQSNRFDGTVHGYEGVHGTGAAVVTLAPSVSSLGDKEYDEDDVEVYSGDRGVLQGSAAPPPGSPGSSAGGPVTHASSERAPRPVGAYPHARRVGDLLYLSGVGPRQPGTDAIPGGPIVDEQGRPRDYDAGAQTAAVIANIAAILEEAGSSLDRVVDVTSFLIDMDRDFAAYNAAYAEGFGTIMPTRTTVAIRALPTPIAVEMKVIALPGDGA